MSLLDSERDRHRILDSTLSTVGIQAGIIKELVAVSDRLQEALNASVRELERLSAELQRRNEDAANLKRIS